MYFPDLPLAGDAIVQIVESGPDQARNSIREIYHAAITSARQRLWIASPYFIPDAGLLDAIHLARYRGVDVRLLTIARPDHYVSFYAGRYYWTEVMAAGVHVYEYQRGMMHSKLIMADGEWGMVGSANLDNRSLHLNFEVGCLLHSPALVAEVERAFLQDLEDARLVVAEAFARRSFASRLAENTCRLMSPIL
jgi:cardiolipin synthase